MNEAQNVENTDISQLCYVRSLDLKPSPPVLFYDGNTHTPSAVRPSFLPTFRQSVALPYFSCTVLEARTRCRPMGGGTDPASDASGPCSDR